MRARGEAVEIRPGAGDRRVRDEGLADAISRSDPWRPTKQPGAFGRRSRCPHEKSGLDFAVPPVQPMPVHTASILATFDRLARLMPEAPALIDGTDGRVTTRAQLAERQATLAAQLAEAGIRPGDLIVLQMRNSASLVAAILAAWQASAAVAPVDRDATAAEVAAVMTHFGGRALLWKDDQGHVRLERSESQTRLPNGVVLVKLSSGSSGVPKGVLTSAGNLLADCENILTTMQLSGRDINLGAIPFSHSYGFSNLVMPLLMRGIPIVHTNDYLPLSILALSNRYRCTVLPGVPLMLDHLSRLPREDGRLETIRTVISAGAPLSAETSQQFFRRFELPIHTFYGASECGGIAYDRTGRAVERGEIGRAMEGVRLSIDPVHSTLVVESDAVANGYIGASAEDNRRFVSSSFRTDDLASLADDGTVRLEGRAGDLMNIAGKKVNPREIEAVIAQIEGVQEARVFGESAGARGDIVVAVVVAEEGVTRDAIRSWCMQHLSGFKVPRVVRFVAAIPVDERGKVRRDRLRGLVDQRS